MRLIVAVVVCAAGLLITLSGVSLQRQAGNFDREGASPAFEDVKQERYSRAELITRVGIGVFGVGGIVGLTQCLLRLRRPDTHRGARGPLMSGSDTSHC